MVIQTEKKENENKIESNSTEKWQGENFRVCYGSLCSNWIDLPSTTNMVDHDIDN